MSQLYTQEKKTISAHTPRLPGTTLLAEDQRRLKLVYHKFTTTTPRFTTDQVRINVLFTHGTGMNKSVWNYHIRRLYEESTAASTWYLGSVIAFDNIAHGDSAMLNNDILGWTNGWTDGGKDIIKIVQHEIDTTGDFVNGKYSKNIAVGHSLGGHQTLMAGYLEPHLFDVVIPIEAPYYYDLSQRDRYIGVFKKVSRLIQDEFDTLEDFYTYYRKYSFYQTMQPEVLSEMLEDEYYTVYDPATNTTKYRSKASKQRQASCYFSSMYNLKKSYTMVPLLECKCVFVEGEKATWNPPQATKYFQDTADPNALLKVHTVPGGTHMCFGEKPDELVAMLKQLFEDRSKFALDAVKFYPESIYHNDKKKILDHQFGLVMAGRDYEAINFYDKPDYPKL
ncbi:hypothetical protein PSN45_002611 [Yamadazyma tenuis]|uniref:Alpha/beta-hydrolase n=1 Tax=Candida tenuis (strain ATCC 10573 / BCRC 21748 / CBS 615 / JCM 9827 / NBRC 10315 / NRRL Y-1498 / VKM Y-70) TaxID=590646 RepID=G3AZV0_CANTC|nr:uncharacterized protein CANTEDRAFT_119372 [Yamadazyma tenuis ATCC 10573]XP_006684931.1 alpha/beta-hydrolase [Yamadazyma tenuis ATCC 10573]EGV65244.1 hypothetical protein CANTEDRAFT_119372 [Yamadazyma tenuis ATCC 10573]EGV65245.1 alpha/beta-hydrolase [Yamadazyma tenuis ATCC 10573]WEJ95101.1 hypothetical protein PSN45_002611 [Yamadazyma tenuis]